MKTVVGLYNTVAEANKVKTALASEGYENEHITVIDQTGDGNTTTGTTGSSESFTGKIKDFFTGFSRDEDEHAQYASHVGNGGALLAVTVPDDEADETADLLYEHGATGIQGETGSSYSSGSGAEDVAVLEGNTRGSATAVSGEQVIPVVEEELVVGKRNVDRGGVRIYSHLVEEPVSADVTLHNERIVVDRTPVNRAATEADFATGTGSIELNATGEEAVVGKTSRVVEEVRVGKQSSERTEQINDTVRHTEVEVEPTTVTTTKDRY